MSQVVRVLVQTILQTIIPVHEVTTFNSLIVSSSKPSSESTIWHPALLLADSEALPLQLPRIFGKEGGGFGTMRQKSMGDRGK